MAIDLTQPQLFLDDTMIAATGRVQRVWHQPRKYPDPVLVADRPWEHNCPVAFGSVLQREGRFQMWYCGWTRQRPPVVCYAESDDGVHWTKPELGLHEVCGTRANNVVLVTAHPEGKALIDDISVIDDAAADPQWPLKALYWDACRDADQGKPYGIWAARSRDGINWEKLGQVLPEWGDRFNAVSQRLDGKFVLYGRAPAHQRQRYGQIGRHVYRTESADLVQWSEPELVLRRDPDDPLDMEYYSAMAFPYGDVLLGSIERMHMSPDVLDPELIWSRDGGHAWQRIPHRPVFLERGAGPRWDSAWINLTANTPIRAYGQQLFYYSGRSTGHGSPYPFNHGAIGLAALRIDGFCSLRANDQPGFVQTPELTWPGGELLLNADTRRDLTTHPRNTTTGEVGVGVSAPDGEDIPGFTASDCQALCGNTVSTEGRGEHSYAPLRFGDSRSLNELAGRRIRLTFRLRDAHLYSFMAG